MVGIGIVMILSGIAVSAVGFALGNLRPLPFRHADTVVRIAGDLVIDCGICLILRLYSFV